MPFVPDYLAKRSEQNNLAVNKYINVRLNAFRA